MVASTGAATRPSRFSPRQNTVHIFEEVAAVDRIELMRKRQASGKHPHTGKMLTGIEALQWLRHWAGLSEEFHASVREPSEWKPGVVALLQCDPKSVMYLHQNGNVITLARTVKKEIDSKGRKRWVVDVKLVSKVRA